MDHPTATATPLRVTTLTPIRGVPILPDSDPRLRFPVHARFLEERLVASGEDPAGWTILDAAEVGLDEDGMRVRFSMLRRSTRRLAFRTVAVRSGELVGITDEGG